MRVTLLSSCLGCAAIACASGSSPTSPPNPSAAAPARVPIELSYEQLVAAADSYVDAGKAERGLETAQDAARKDAARPEAYRSMGRALAVLGRLDEAARAYESARAKGSTDRQLVIELGSVYDIATRYSEARELYRAYLATQSDDAEIVHELGLTLLLTHDAKEAMKTLERAVQLDPTNADYAQDLGYAQLDAGEPERAARTLGTLVHEHADRAEAWLLLARSQASMGRHLEAQKTAAQCIEHAKHGDEDGKRLTAQALRLQGRLALVLGDATAALTVYESLLQGGETDAVVQLGIAAALMALGRLDEAESKMKAVGGKFPDHPLVRLRLRELDARRGDLKALNELVGLADKAGGSPELWRACYETAKAHKVKPLEKQARAKLAALGVILP